MPNAFATKSYTPTSAKISKRRENYSELTAQDWSQLPLNISATLVSATLLSAIFFGLGEQNFLYRNISN